MESFKRWQRRATECSIQHVPQRFTVFPQIHRAISHHCLMTTCFTWHIPAVAMPQIQFSFDLIFLHENSGKMERFQNLLTGSQEERRIFFSFSFHYLGVMLKVQWVKDQSGRVMCALETSGVGIHFWPCKCYGLRPSSYSQSAQVVLRPHLDPKH